MWRIALIFLTGCTTTQKEVVTAPVYHPTLPPSLVVCPVKWEVLEVKGKAKVALSYNDNVTAAICNKDIERYLSQLLNITCHYRQKLKESICIDNKE